MKKQIKKVAFVAGIVMIFGAYFMNLQRSETLSEVALANVEALASIPPGGESRCFWDSKEYLLCDENGIWTACICDGEIE